MAPIWPFKKKQEVLEVDEEPPPTISYKKGEDPNARPATTTVDASAYKDALALFGGGSSNVEAASDQSVNYDGVAEPTGTSTVAEESQPVKEESFTWVHHTDGYHYKKNADGSFEPTPHSKNADGSYVPYA
jgi:hypothetical protein